MFPYQLQETHIQVIISQQPTFIISGLGGETVNTGASVWKEKQRIGESKKNKKKTY